MTTAADVREFVKQHEQQDVRVDAFIDDYLRELFVETIGAPIQIPTHRIQEIREDSDMLLGFNDWFMKQMRSRGFDIEMNCEDIPCGQCWFIISLPV